jgi:Tol biopolymer transport system component/DNA-binding winged helix-turn-helix (wHTH) protein
VFQFGEFELHCGRFQLLRKGRPLRVEPKPLGLLILLVSRKGNLVTRREIVEKLWESDVFVDTDLSINTAIRKLRYLLRDDSETPKYIETATGTGYRFIAPVVEVGEGVANAAPRLPSPAAEREAAVEDRAGRPGAKLQRETENDGEVAAAASIPSTSLTATSSHQHRGRRRWPILGVACVIAALVALWYMHRPLPPLRIKEYIQITHDAQMMKMLAGTDGSRLYFNQFQPKMVSQVSIAGGKIAPVPLPVKGPFVEDVSGDGSTLLVASEDEGDVWSVGVLGEPVRHVTKADVGWGALSIASWSPDGKFIAFSTQNGEIYRIHSDGSDLEKLSDADVKGTAWALTWSPDGETLRFTRDQKLWEMPSHGSSPHELLAGWTGGDWKCCGRWTQDGAFYVFVSGRQPNPLSGETLWALDERKRFLERPPSQPIQLTSGPTRWGSPFPSRDGKTIFARGVTLRGELDRLDPQTKQFQSYLGGISAEFISFSRDGKWIAYVSFPDGVLWKANRDGSGPVQLTDPPLHPQALAWSPDDSQIAFLDQPVGATYPEAFVVSTQGGNPERLLAEEKRPVIGVNWSPDGRKIAFASCNCIFPAVSNSFIRVLDTASQKVTTVPGSENMWAPTWSPDGRYIAVISVVGPSFDPRVYDLETKLWTVLPIGYVGDWPTWSRDSRYLYFLRTWKDPAVIRVSIASAKVEDVVDLSGFQMTAWNSTWFGLDPMDAPLLLRNRGSEELYALTLERK